MLIYTGSPGGSQEKLDQIIRFNMGIMLSTETLKSYSKVPCALDNGAFEAHRRGLPWMEERFFAMIKKCWDNNLTLDFIVCPDIIAGGKDSLIKSNSYVNKLKPARLALAVQDGIEPKDLDSFVWKNYDVIFVGGSEEWKWETAEDWVMFAHINNKKCHIGRVGTLAKLQRANEIGADSVDSTSFVRNEYWHVIDHFQNNTHQNLFNN